MKRSYDATADPQDRTPFLKALFASQQQWYFADLHTFTLLQLGYPDPLVLRWTSATHDLVFEGNRYAGGERISETEGDPGARIKRGAVRSQIGISVDDLEVTIFLDGTDLLPPADGNEDTPRFSLHEAFNAGLFESAEHSLRRLFMPRPPAYPVKVADVDVSCGAVTLFAGQVTESHLTRTKAVLTTKSHVERLSIPMPRRIFQRNCPFTLYEPNTCGVDPAGSAFSIPFRLDTVVITATEAHFLVDPGEDALSRPPGIFTLGTLLFTSGVLAGTRRGIRSEILGAVELQSPLPRLPNVGDGVRLQAGCNKTKDDCENKFSNFVDQDDPTKGLRFGGFPAVPPPDTAV